MLTDAIIRLNSGKEFTATVLFYQFMWAGNSNNVKILFKMKYSGATSEYEYNWTAGPTMGISNVYKEGQQIYNPYSKNNTIEAYDSLEVGRQISVMLWPKVNQKETSFPF